MEQKHISSVVMELKPPPAQEAVVQRPSKRMTMAWKKHGSKLNAVAQRLQKIRADDPAAKALVFVQWADLEAKVCNALADHRIPYLNLSGDKRGLGKKDGETLKNFQAD